MIPAPGEGYVRLSPRKLLLDPVKAIGQAVVPVVIALVGISRSDTRFWPIVFPLVVIGPLVLGALPWLTTHYRLTGTQIQVRRGILNKTTSTAPLDRVRSVDLEASLLHRILGLQLRTLGIEQREDTREKPYYWLRFLRERREQSPDSDVAVLKRGAVAVTPLKFDRTDMDAMAGLRQMLA